MSAPKLSTAEKVLAHKRKVKAEQMKRYRANRKKREANNK